MITENAGEFITTLTTLDYLGKVKFVKAMDEICSIDEKVNIPKNVKYAIAHDENYFAIDEADCLLSWGDNINCPLGHGHNERITEPTVVEALKDCKVKEIHVVDEVVLCIATSGRLYVWGKGDMFGFNEVKFPSPVGITQCGRVQHAAFVQHHGLLICSDANVYSVGSNGLGELGLGHTEAMTGFQKIDRFNPGEVIKVQAGSRKSAVLTKNGEVYVFGGWGGVYHPRPHLVDGLTGVVDISLTSHHILALTSNNELFAWGVNEHGECGIGSTIEYISKPSRVLGLKNCEILQVSAGNYKSVIKFKSKNQ